MPGSIYSTDAIVGNMRFVPASGSAGFSQGSPSPEPCREPGPLSAGTEPGAEKQFTHVLTRSLGAMETEATRRMWSDLKQRQPSLPADPTCVDYGSGLGNPIQCVSWYQAILFANLLSRENQLTPAYYKDSQFSIVVDANNYLTGNFACNFGASGYRLPTEGEWEHFARANTTGPFSIYETNYLSNTCNTCSNNILSALETAAWFCPNAVGPLSTRQVGQKVANPWNLKDLHGNVFEWCWDWYGIYPTAKVTNYTGVATGTNRVLRGGGWARDARYARSAARYHYHASSEQYNGNGFRLVRSLLESTMHVAYLPIIMKRPSTTTTSTTTTIAPHTTTTTTSHVTTTTTAGATTTTAAGATTTTTSGATTTTVPQYYHVNAIAAGANHSCALALEFTRGNLVLCWGANWAGQLGDGTFTSHLVPAPVVTDIPHRFQAIVASNNYTCARMDWGGVKCWGVNGHGQLGDGTTNNRSTPVDVVGLSQVTALSIGSFHACVIDNSEVKCWGGNDAGQLGDGTTIGRSTPATVAGLGGARAISAGEMHTCALTLDWGVKCWGQGDFGQLGNGTTTDCRTPVDVSGLTNGVSSIAAGGAFSCALTSSGVKCWGNNVYGQLGNATVTSCSTPVSVVGLPTSGNAISAIAAGGLQACALISTNNGVKCWGQNDHGQLGNGTINPSTIPVDVVGLPGATDIAMGWEHTCTMSSGTWLRCWGANLRGQLGDGTTTDRHIPTKVFGFTN